MKQSQSISKIMQALAKFRKSVPTIIKNKENPFYNSKYADLPGIFVAIQKPLEDNGFSFSQAAVSDPVPALETVLYHIPSGEWISSSYPLNPAKNDPQAMASAVTYARRYALSAMLGIVTEDEDDDGNRASPPPSTSKKEESKVPASTQTATTQSNSSQDSNDFMVPMTWKSKYAGKWVSSLSYQEMGNQKRFWEETVQADPKRNTANVQKLLKSINYYLGKKKEIESRSGINDTP